MTPLIRAVDAAFGYEGRPVVGGLDLAIEPGDFIGIVGPNGGGKTTLFRGLLGLLSPLSGSVRRSTEAIGYVPQRETLDPIYPLQVQEVVHMGAYGRLTGLRRLSRADRDLALANLARVGLPDMARRAFMTLSGGQRQRVLIARALMVRPALLLLDEPTSGVDRFAEEHILSLLLDLNRTEGLAILLVSHHLAMVRRAVQDVLVVADGHVRRGAAEELLSNLEPWLSSGGQGATPAR